MALRERVKRIASKIALGCALAGCGGTAHKGEPHFEINTPTAMDRFHDTQETSTHIPLIVPLAENKSLYPNGFSYQPELDHTLNTLSTLVKTHKFGALNDNEQHGANITGENKPDTRTYEYISHAYTFKPDKPGMKHEVTVSGYLGQTFTHKGQLHFVLMVRKKGIPAAIIERIRKVNDAMMK